MSLKEKTMVKPNVWELEVSIDAETFEAAIQRAYNKKKKSITVPGFRKGKATRSMIEGRFGKGFFYEDALDECYGAAAQAAIDESDLDYYATEGVDIVSIGEEGVELKITVAVNPVVEITEYKGLKAQKKKVEATEEEIDERIEALRERNSRVIAVEGRAAENGDIAVIDFKGFMNGEAFEGGAGEGYELTLGSNQFVPGFEEQIVGHNIGEEFDIVITFPEEYHEELAGKEATFKITLHELKTKQLPEVDDDFAQEAQDCDTVADLRKSVAKEIEERKTLENDREIDKQLRDKLVENVSADIPDSMIANEVNGEIQNMEYRMASQGLSIELYLQYMGMTREDYEEQLKPECERKVKLRLALKKIAELEAFEVTDEEIEAEYAKYAEMYSMEVEKIKEAIPAEGVKGDILLEKAMTFVRDNAKITTARKSAAKAESKE